MMMLSCKEKNILISQLIQLYLGVSEKYDLVKQAVLICQTPQRRVYFTGSKSVRFYTTPMLLGISERISRQKHAVKESL